MILFPEELAATLKGKSNEEILSKYQEFNRAAVAYFRLGKIQQAMYFKEIAEAILNFEQEKNTTAHKNAQQMPQSVGGESETKDLGQRRIVIRPFQKNNEPEVY
jgi:hypothetical protein